jgi:hypothetical protein
MLASDGTSKLFILELKGNKNQDLLNKNNWKLFQSFNVLRKMPDGTLVELSSINELEIIPIIQNS